MHISSKYYPNLDFPKINNKYYEVNIVVLKN